MRSDDKLRAACRCLLNFSQQGHLPNHAETSFWLIKDVQALAIDMLPEDVKDGFPV